MSILPDNIIQFVNYLKVANGGITEINQYIPDASKYLITPDDIELSSTYATLPQKV